MRARSILLASIILTLLHGSLGQRALGAAASIQGAQPKKRPNILFIMSDDHATR